MNNEIILHDTPAPLDKLNNIPDKDVDIIERDSKGRWLPGCTPNPLGRQGNNKKEYITPYLKKLLDEEVDGKPRSMMVAESLYELALRPNANQLPAIKEVLDRTDGKVREQIEVESRNITLVYELVQPET